MHRYSLTRPELCHFDLMPQGGRGFLVSLLALSLTLRAVAWLLAPDPGAILASHDWMYHTFWLPLHLILARYAGRIFGRHAQDLQATASPKVRPQLAARIAAVVSFRGFVGSLLLVSPFALLDLGAGVAFVEEHFASQGQASALIPLIWMVEWFATAQIWLYVLGSIYITPLGASVGNLRGRYREVLLHGQGRESILAGLENALVILAYGLTTIGYVWYAKGQLSDYLVLGISTVLAIVCFFTALVSLKSSLRQLLDERHAEVLKDCPAWGLAAQGAAPVDAASVPVQFLVDSTDALYAKPLTSHKDVNARIRALKLAVLLPAGAKEDPVARARADELRVLVECEVRLHEFGVGEVRSMLLRAGMPLLVIAGKSVGGLIGLH